MSEYPDISDHGLIGDLQTAALVDTEGSIDWFCAPRFDSPSVFGSLLDARARRLLPRAPETDDYVTRQLYLPDTAILLTRFMTQEGVGEVLDFMPIAGDEPTDRHRIARLDPRRPGVHDVRRRDQARVHYGTVAHTGVEPALGDGVLFRGGDQALTVHRVGEIIRRGEQQAGTIELIEGGLRVHGHAARRRAHRRASSRRAAPRRARLDR